MNTGLKILIKKIIDKFKYPKFLYSQMPIDVFPNASSSKFQTKARLFGVENELKNRSIAFNLGSLYTLSHPVATQAYQLFIKYNPNHLGNWSNKEPKQGTEQLEYEVIQEMIDLYHASKEGIEGHTTSGGTEGNIYSLWLGRLYLEKLCAKDTICLLKTSLSHYSIRKAGNICNIPQFLTPLNSQEWNIDVKNLSKKVKNLYKIGYRGFLLPLTIGYTSTGTQDNIQEITKTIKKLEKELKNTHFYIWIDAALNGLIEPFINENFEPFASPLIQTLVVDFHKFGMVPYSSGIVLYRKSLRKNIELKIDYLQEKDNTLLGSRQGASAASIWTIIHHLGKSGFRNLIFQQLKNKNYFIKNIQNIFPEAEITTHKNSLTCGVIFHSLKNQRLPKFLEEKYWLYPGLTNLVFETNIKKRQIIYKFFFLPHLKKRVLEEFFSDLKQALLFY